MVVCALKWTVADNQSRMATEGGIDMLIDLLQSPNEHVQRQAAKALANLGVNGVCLCIVSSAIPALRVLKCSLCVYGLDPVMLKSRQQGAHCQGRRHQTADRPRELQANRRRGRSHRGARQLGRQWYRVSYI
jgi:hypothetical protein